MWYSGFMTKVCQYRGNIFGFCPKKATRLIKMGDSKPLVYLCDEHLLIVVKSLKSGQYAGHKAREERFKWYRWLI